MCGFAGLGFRVPNHLLLVELLREMSVPLACTSANLHGQKVITDEQILQDTFDGKVDYIFCDDARVACYSRIDITIHDITRGF